VASRGRKIRAGLFAIAAAALAVFAVLAFGGMRVLRGGDPYHVVFEGTVYGLEDGANVYMNGVRVGAVDTIEVSPDHPGQVRVRIVVASGTPVRTDTRAMLQFTGITGLKVIDLRGGTPTAAALPPGSTIPAGETTFDRLERRAAELADQSVALVERANAILDHVVQLTQRQVYVPVLLGDPSNFDRLSDPCGCRNERPDHVTRALAHVFVDLGVYDWTEALRRLETPTLVVHGELDQIPIESATAWVDALPSARLLALPGVGHFPWAEAPDEFFGAVNRFLVP
jgi:pimeloyl-ACP methyl ester carboxylesterase